MWRELESYKNHFLQKQMSYVPPERINQMVKKGFDKRQFRKKVCRFPTEAECNHSLYFEDRAQLAYGNRALPKLMEDICSDFPLVKWQSLNTLSELLRNPMEAQRAITEMDIVRKTQNIFLRIQHKFHKELYRETDALMQIYYLLSFYLNGAEQIAHRVNLLNEFYRIIRHKMATADVSAKILRNMTEKPEILLFMWQESKAFDLLTDIFKQDKCRGFYPEPLWLHLSHFLEIAPEDAIKNDFFYLMHLRIVGRLPHYHKECMKCFALLLRCQKGQELFDEVDGVKMIYDILKTEKLCTLEFVVQTLLQGMVSKRALWRTREFTDLPDILVALAKETDNTRLQLYCFQALRLMGDMPCVKNYMRAACLTELDSFDCLNRVNECNRDDLVNWINREIYDSTELHPSIAASLKK